jgi:hypothetical protein
MRFGGFLSSLIDQGVEAGAGYVQGTTEGEREKFAREQAAEQAAAQAAENAQRRAAEERRVRLQEALLELRATEADRENKEKQEERNRITVHGRTFPNTPEGGRAAAAWRAEYAEAGRDPKRRDPNQATPAQSASQARAAAAGERTQERTTYTRQVAAARGKAAEMARIGASQSTIVQYLAKAPEYKGLPDGIRAHAAADAMKAHAPKASAPATPARTPNAKPAAKDPRGAEIRRGLVERYGPPQSPMQQDMLDALQEGQSPQHIIDAMQRAGVGGDRLTSARKYLRVRAK